MPGELLVSAIVRTESEAQPNPIYAETGGNDVASWQL